MATVRKRQVEIIAAFGKSLDQIGSKVRRRDQRGKHRRKIAPLTVDFDSESQFEPVDAAGFELRIEVAHCCQPMGEVVLDLDLETLRPQFGSLQVQKIEPVVGIPERQVAVTSLGILGADPEVRNGFNGIRVHYKIDADATPEEIEGLVAQSQKRSAVFDVVANPPNITVQVN